MNKAKLSNPTCSSRPIQAAPTPVLGFNTEMEPYETCVDLSFDSEDNTHQSEGSETAFCVNNMSGATKTLGLGSILVKQTPMTKKFHNKKSINWGTNS